MLIGIQLNLVASSMRLQEIASVNLQVEKSADAFRLNSVSYVYGQRWLYGQLLN